MGCPTNTNVQTDNTPLECKDYISNKCIVHEGGITFLNLAPGATQEEVNNALVLALIAALNRISELENLNNSD